MGQLQIATTLSISLVFVLLCTFHQAWGGCSRFGHSCFGAHGKRSDGTPRIDTNVPEVNPPALIEGFNPYGYGLPQQPPDYQLPIGFRTGNEPRNYNRINPYLLQLLSSPVHGRPSISSQEISRESETRK